MRTPHLVERRLMSLRAGRGGTDARRVLPALEHARAERVVQVLLRQLG